MKEIKYLLISFVILCTLSCGITSCNDDDDDLLSSTALLPSKAILEDDNSTVSFSYDGSNRLTKVEKNLQAENTYSSLDIYYNDLGQIYQTVKTTKANEHEYSEVISFSYDSYNKISYTHKKADNTTVYEGRIIINDKDLIS
ncbi:MAG: hypothetical protein E6767_13190 [Dysgonomonas sp.]|nr:hypothetical protein [Dysgonomonas sp.]